MTGYAVTPGASVLVVGCGFTGMGRDEIRSIFEEHNARVYAATQDAFEAFDRVAKSARGAANMMILTEAGHHNLARAFTLEPEPQPNAHGWYRMHAPKLRAPKCL